MSKRLEAPSLKRNLRENVTNILDTVHVAYHQWLQVMSQNKKRDAIVGIVRTKKADEKNAVLQMQKSNMWKTQY